MGHAGPASVHLLRQVQRYYILRLDADIHACNSIQYRMHSHISAFPSAAFYESRLTNGPDMDSKTLQPWHSNSLFPPYAFMHVKGGSEQQGRFNSLYNPLEASTAVAIYDRLLRDFPTIDFNYRVGVVTPYKGQVIELKKQFRQRFGADIIGKVSFNTVDVSSSFRLRIICICMLIPSLVHSSGISRAGERHNNLVLRQGRFGRQIGRILSRYSVRQSR